MDTPTLRELLESWELNLKAEHKSPMTIRSYRDGVRFYIKFCEEHGFSPSLDKASVNSYVAHYLETYESTTAIARMKGVKRFSAWLAEEGEISSDQIATLKLPHLDQKVIPELTEEECKALIAACKGNGFRERRDEALVRFMLETMTRAGEVVLMEIDDLNLQNGTATIRRGKGGKGRTVSFGDQTRAAIDRYVRMRRRSPQASSKKLWLGTGTRTFAYGGLYRTLLKRGQSAGLKNFHPHILRHTGAGRWLEKGGSEGGLMSVAGWEDSRMVYRYTKATSAKRAAEEARRLNLGDL